MSRKPPWSTEMGLISLICLAGSPIKVSRTHRFHAVPCVWRANFCNTGVNNSDFISFCALTAKFCLFATSLPQTPQREFFILSSESEHHLIFPIHKIDPNKLKFIHHDCYLAIISAQNSGVNQLKIFNFQLQSNP